MDSIEEKLRQCLHASRIKEVQLVNGLLDIRADVQTYGQLDRQKLLTRINDTLKGLGKC